MTDHISLVMMVSLECISRPIHSSDAYATSRHWLIKILGRLQALTNPAFRGSARFLDDAEIACSEGRFGARGDVEFAIDVLHITGDGVAGDTQYPRAFA